MSQTVLIPLIIVAFLIAFPLMWSLVVGLTAVFGGWRKLARTYPAQPAKTAEWRTGCTGRMGGFFSLGYYKSTLSIGKDETHLHLKPMILFSMFHPQISIPLGDITREGSGRGFFNSVKLSFAKTGVPLKISGKLADWVLQ